jgi:hypothetical protein
VAPGEDEAYWDGGAADDGAEDGEESGEVYGGCVEDAAEALLSGVSFRPIK